MSETLVGPFWAENPTITDYLHTNKGTSTVDSGSIYDDEEKQLSACSSRTGSSVKAEGLTGWAGNHPCVYGPKEGCSIHNPHKLPIAYNKRIPSDKKKPSIVKRLIGQPETPDHGELQRSELIWSPLHLDCSTADPLEPIHASIRYALAYYHLNWVRSAPNPTIRATRVNSLVCHGTVPGNGKHRPDFQFWAHPLWHKDSFLLQQVVKFAIVPRRPNPVLGREFVILGWPSRDWTFQICPHYRHRFQDYEFRETRGLRAANMSYTTKKLDFLGDCSRQRTEWRSVYGPNRRTYNCQRCCTDSSVRIDLVQGNIEVELWVYRDLGKASSAFDAKWIAALRPEARKWRRTGSDAASNTVATAVRAAIEEGRKLRGRSV